MIQVPIVNDTIPHPVKLKYKAARLMIMPAAPGTGLIAGSSIRKVLELAGVKNVLSKNIGTSNRVVIGQAMLRVLKKLQMTEAAEKFVAEMKKEAEAAKQKRAAARKESDKAGRGNRSRKPSPVAATKPEKSELKQAAEKAAEEKGRLEKEMEEKA